MPLLIVTSVGTSLLTNCMPPEKRGGFFRLSNHREADLDPAQRAYIDEAVANAASALASADVRRIKQLSAEFNGLLSRLAEETAHSPGCVHHLLIATDTYAGRCTGGLVRDWLLSRGQSTDLWCPVDLRTADLDEFRISLAKLVDDLLPLIESFRARGYEPVFNLTGGFKGVNGFLQALAGICQAEAVYVFEGSDALLRIPRLPVRLDAESIIGDNLELFRRLAAGLPVGEIETRKAGLPETLLFLVDGKAALSEWGRLMWRQAWRNLAEQKLLAPRSEKIRLSKRFQSEVAALAAPRMRAVNDAIEALCLRLERNVFGQRAAFELKKFSGDPTPPSTHELYAWSDGATGRIFLHQEDGGWLIDRIDGHL